MENGARQVPPCRISASAHEDDAMYERFGLVLVVNHACNLRCDYCYTGAKFGRSMPAAVGRRAIERAVASLQPAGSLELGFFGGEPLLEAALIAELVGFARERARTAGLELRVGLTTNGTVAQGDAWELLTRPELDLAVSFDGLPELHDRHRRFADGRDSAALVLSTMRRLLDAGKEFSVVVVVRPDTVSRLPEGVRFLRGLGVRQVEPSLDLWCSWSRQDGAALARAVTECARLWREGLPEHGLSWFDDRVARLAAVPATGTARCGFGAGEIAVAPSGRLYPCERLVGEDLPTSAIRLPGLAQEGADFLSHRAAEPRSASECSACPVQELCGTTCRCANYLRTGNVSQPDGLLCLLDQVCLRETARVLAGDAGVAPALRDLVSC